MAPAACVVNVAVRKTTGYAIDGSGLRPMSCWYWQLQAPTACCRQHWTDKLVGPTSCCGRVKERGHWGKRVQPQGKQGWSLVHTIQGAVGDLDMVHALRRHTDGLGMSHNHVPARVVGVMAVGQAQAHTYV